MPRNSAHDSASTVRAALPERVGAPPNVAFTPSVHQARVRGTRHRGRACRAPVFSPMVARNPRRRWLCERWPVACITLDIELSLTVAAPVLALPNNFDI
ncbi:hypothetical protein CBM2592_B40291 [Cupriavidus taiwanensis]|nr:hypothetical protein CBM2592_B40291 [Cupriavidus taiwanensis]SOY72152.1 hypothetical protein CBM2588_B40107 [Cupriavidus taiwanensis]SOY95717.1 hypothetical protein CBM2591_B20288 [Cupriavidus taiwanensis]SOZ74900.1 hypothetical protein CBM2617_B60205 [Cupriavidus taiwanensis]SOZ88464.1 hypothetical protein CBM2618_B50208 [Cupriavidus taiwanensis]